EQKTVLFRIAQESLTNVARHARASHVGVTLRKTIAGIQLEIWDNGKSFDVDRQLSAKGKKRLGLLGMQERARLVNGQFTVLSSPGRGTTVRAEIPVNTIEQKAKRYVLHHNLIGRRSYGGAAGTARLVAS